MEKGLETKREYLIGMGDMESFYDEPGERGWIMEGEKHGFGNTTVIVTDTAPLGGPPLHSHVSEEIHVLPESLIAYVIGSDFFEVVGPCGIRIPAGVPHTFLNVGADPVRLVCFFPYNNFWGNFEDLGTNPLLERYGVGANP